MVISSRERSRGSGRVEAVEPNAVGLNGREGD